VLSTDHIHAHAYSRVGHKGLIFDRLDAGVGVGVADRGEDGSFTPGQFVGHASTGFDVPRIVPFARGLYHNRNRVYVPELGRFAQADPNASGQSLLDMPVYHGRAFSAGAISFDVQARYGDGGSLYGYMGGNPWMNSDSMGLFFSPVDLVGTLVMGAIRTLRGGVENMITTYAMNLELDVDWAMDWSQSDDWHTRGDNLWVAESFKEGMWGGLQDWLNEDVMGLIDPFGIGGIDFDLGPMATRTPRSWNRAAIAANATGKVAHHVITMYRRGQEFSRKLSRKYNFRIDLQNPRHNFLALGPTTHGGGRHRTVYSNRVFKYISEGMEQANKYGRAAQAEFERLMAMLRVDIENNPNNWF